MIYMQIMNQMLILKVVTGSFKLMSNVADQQMN